VASRLNGRGILASFAGLPHLSWGGGRPVSFPFFTHLHWTALAVNHEDGTAGRRYLGSLPPAGQWRLLEIPASAVGLEGRVVTGMAFTLFDGRATCDYVGKTSR